jgi:hypothetical protein
MRKFTQVTLVAFSLFFSAQVFAADPPAPKQVVSEQDAVAVQKGVKDLAKAFGVETPAPVQPAAPATESTPAPQKNMADVMDKAIDKVSDVVGLVAESMRKIAPEIWTIMIKQQYAKAVGDLVVPVALTMLIYALVVRRMKKICDNEKGKGKKKEGSPDEDDDPGFTQNGDLTDYGTAFLFYIASWVGFSLSALWLANRLADTSKYLINPDYYAIQDLLRMLLSRSVQ